MSVSSGRPSRCLPTHSVPRLVETDEKEALLILELVSLLIRDLDIVFDEAEQMTGRLVEATALPTSQPLSKVIYRKVDEDKSLYDELTIWAEIESVGELLSDCATSLGRPVAWRLACGFDVDSVHDGRVLHRRLLLWVLVVGGGQVMMVRKRVQWDRHLPTNACRLQSVSE